MATAAYEASAAVERALDERHMLLMHLRGFMSSIGRLSRYRDLLDEHGL